eukprot:UN06000
MAYGHEALLRSLADKNAFEFARNEQITPLLNQLTPTNPNDALLKIKNDCIELTKEMKKAFDNHSARWEHQENVIKRCLQQDQEDIKAYLALTQFCYKTWPRPRLKICLFRCV